MPEDASIPKVQIFIVKGRMKRVAYQRSLSDIGHKNTTYEETQRNGIGQRTGIGKSEKSTGIGSFESSFWLHFTLGSDIPAHNTIMGVCFLFCLCVLQSVPWNCRSEACIFEFLFSK